MDDLKKLLEENIKLNQDLKKDIRYIKKYVMWVQLFGVLKYALIILTIIWSVVYLPPIIKDSVSSIQSFMGQGNDAVVQNLLGGKNLEAVRKLKSVEVKK